MKTIHNFTEHDVRNKTLPKAETNDCLELIKCSKYKDLAPSSFIDQENSTILANRNNSQDIMTSHVPQYRDIFLTEEGSNNNFNLKVIIY